MRNLPKLTPDAQAALRIILDHGVIVGASLMRLYGAQQPAGGLLKAIDELRQGSLIETGGEVSADSLPFATFGVRPSAKEYLSLLINPR